MTVEWWAWVAVIGFILAMLAVDLLFFHRDAHEVSIREAATWSAIWIALSLAFGALVARGAFIFAGVALLEAFHWTIYVFGALLVFTGVRMAAHADPEVHPEHNPMLNLLRRVMPITDEYAGQRFFTRRDGRRWATPLLAVLVVIETTDVLFAIDSIPAVFAITHNPFLVFTSNAFAILGLRALYFLLAGFLGRLAYLNVGLAAVLVFVGIKMVLTDVFHVPVWASLLTIAALIGASVVVSLRHAPVAD